MKIKAKCRSCNKFQPAEKKWFLAAAQPRCVSCGGMLDKAGKWIGSGSVSSSVSSVNIPFPGEPSEFEIQSFIYEHLRGIGLNVRGEVMTDGMLCRFDLVVFNENNKPVLIIEVKKRAGGRHKSRAQVKRYEDYGVPVILIGSMSNASGLVNNAKCSARIGKHRLSDLGLSSDEKCKDFLASDFLLGV